MPDSFRRLPQSYDGFDPRGLQDEVPNVIKHADPLSGILAVSPAARSPTLKAALSPKRGPHSGQNGSSRGPRRKDGRDCVRAQLRRWPPTIGPNL